jgi:hypothetical protein
LQLLKQVYLITPPLYGVRSNIGLLLNDESRRAWKAVFEDGIEKILLNLSKGKFRARKQV